MPRSLLPAGQGGAETGTGPANTNPLAPITSQGQQAQRRDEKGNPFAGDAYREPYAVPSPPPYASAAESGTLGIPGHSRHRSISPSSSDSSRSRSPSPDPQSISSDPRYRDEFTHQKAAFKESQPMSSQQVRGAPEVRTVEGQMVQYLVLPNGVMQIPTKSGLFKSDPILGAAGDRE